MTAGITEDTIIWDKGSSGRRESTDSRCRHQFRIHPDVNPYCAAGYWYDQDPLRIPLSGGMPHRGYSADRRKPHVLRRDGDRDFRVANNPLGRVADAVWHIPAAQWRDSNHTAAFPEEIPRRCLMLGAPPSDLPPVATVIDFYGGSGTVSAVAKKLGLNSLYIDSNPMYAAEAQQRVLNTKCGGTKRQRSVGDRAEHGPVANDNQASAMRAGD